MSKNNKPWPVEIQNYIVEQYKLGRNTMDLAKEFNSYNTSIRRILIKNNVELISTADRLRKVKNNPFNDLNNSDVQYWIGYLIADGSIDANRNCIRLFSKDKEVLENYKKFLNCEVSIRNELQKKYNANCFNIGFNNDEAYKTLINLGFNPDKSHNFKLNLNITWDLLRGYFDGDGCFYYKNNAVNKGDQKPKIILTSGAIEFLTQLQNFLLKNNIKSYIENHNSYYNLIIVIKENINDFYRNIYNNATYFLKRKYEKFGSYYIERYNFESR